LFPIDFQGGIIQNLDGSIENSMSRIISEHISLDKVKKKKELIIDNSLEN
jgi:hypothetical protein